MLSKKSKLLVLIFAVLFLIIVKYVIDNRGEAFPQVLRLITYASLLVAGGLTTLTFGSLLGTFTGTEASAKSHLSRRISEDPARNFYLGFLVTAYLILIRPSLAVDVLFLPFIEWVIIALTIYVVYTMTGFSTKGVYVRSEGLSLKKHIQDVKRETGSDLIRITSVMEQFVDNGVKEPLLIYLTLHLQRLGEDEENILRELRPLIDYQDNARSHKSGFMSFPWARRKSDVNPKKDRETLLNTLLAKIDGLRSR